MLHYIASDFFPPAQHINGAEPEAIRQGVIQCATGKNSLRMGTLVGDQDSSAFAAVVKAKAECNDPSPTRWQLCFLHFLKGSNRRLTQKLMSKAPVDVVDPSSLPDDPAMPFQCSRCRRNFKTSQGRAVHLHACRAKGDAPAPAKTKFSPMEELCKMNALTPKEAKPYMKKLCHWFMLRKLGELKRGVRSYAYNRCYQSKDDLELKARLRKAAATIIPCLSGDHSSCSASFVCKDSSDPYLKSLPHHRNIPVIPKSLQVILRESIWDVFSAAKLDALIANGKIRTTSHVESVHRVIRNAAPKNKPLFRNETPVLKMGAAVAGNRGKGKATLRHLLKMNLPISRQTASALRRLDAKRAQHSRHRKTEDYKRDDARRRRKKYLNHAAGLASNERHQYRKEGFAPSDHTYATASSRCLFRFLFFFFFDDDFGACDISAKNKHSKITKLAKG